MLSKSRVRNQKTSLPRAQGGIVLLIALIILIAMTIAGIALLRSVDISNIIAGNLAFKQAATHAGDIGVERALAFLETNKVGSFLHNDSPTTAIPPMATMPLAALAPEYRGIPIGQTCRQAESGF